MSVAIIGGTGFYRLPGLKGEPQTIATRYGTARVFVGQGEYQDLVFLPRHGPQHSIPPHRINFRANMKALKQLGVTRAVALLAVGSLRHDIPPQGLIAVDQVLDFTRDRANTFFEGESFGVGHTDMTEPYCASLRATLLAHAPSYGLTVRSSGTYVCVNGPRFETAAEVHMFAQLGGDVVGMTGMPEAALARELGIHYAGLAHSLNWAAGLKGDVEIAEVSGDMQRGMLELAIHTVRTAELGKCKCDDATLIVSPPSED